MKFDHEYFDAGLYRMGTRCEKWDGAREDNGDVLPLWVNMHEGSGKLEYNILPLDREREADWQTLFGLDAETFQAARDSHKRTMDIVGTGLQRCRDWLAEDQTHTADAA